MILFERAVARIDNNFVRRRIEECDTAIQAYKEYPAVKSYADAILADDFCQELLAPVVSAYEDEKARIAEVAFSEVAALYEAEVPPPLGGGCLDLRFTPAQGTGSPRSPEVPQRVRGIH